MRRKLFHLGLLGAGLFFALTGSAQPVTSIAGGESQTLFTKGDGSLWVMGGNFMGQLGDGNYFNQTNRPEKIVTSGVAAVAAGLYHSLFLKSDSSLWAMGNNSNGELGDGTYGDSRGITNRPEQIVSSNVTAVAHCNGPHSLFIKSDGSLWDMGYNYFGQLGNGTTNFNNSPSGPYGTNRPVMIVSSNVTAVSGGQFHSLFLKSDGSLWGMGYNGLGQLGDGTFTNTNRPKQIVASNVTAIAAGAYHSLLLKSDGSLWGMGLNNRGQLGDGMFATNGSYGTNSPEMIVASNVTSIATGNSHSLFLKSDGSLWAMGYNYFGQLGDGTTNDANSPKMIVSSNVTVIATGKYNSLFIKSDGSLWGMGQNGGQLGDGTYNNTNQPEMILAGPPPGYNQMSGQPLSGDKMRLSFVGLAGENYALERSFNLSPPNWLPQVTNPASTNGTLAFTNTPNAATNNFWRIRSVP